MDGAGCALLSTLGAAATVALWVRSYRVADWFTYTRMAVEGDLSENTRRLEAFASRGSVRLHWTHRRIPHVFPDLRKPMPDVGPRGGGYNRDTTKPTVAAGFHSTDPNERVWRLGGFYFLLTTPGLPMQYAGGVGVAAPHWFITLLFLLAPVVWLARAYQRLHAARLSRRGHCRVCGYDLRATPDRCPECGAVAGAH